MRPSFRSGCRLGLGQILALLISLFLVPTFAEEKSLETSFEIYKGQKHSFIDWKSLNPNQWLDYRHWLHGLRLKEEDPLWREKRRDLNHRELIGRILACVGDCRIFRGSGYAKAQFLSSLKEGDIVETRKDAYLWIVLVEGTLVRLSPQSSLSFKEINISAKENFLHARLNEGNILWLSREALPFQENNLSQTDLLFFPLKVSEANPVRYQRTLEEGKLEDLLEEDQTHLREIKRLNPLIEENNSWASSKKTKAFLVMPNGSVLGENLNMSFFIKVGAHSYFKKRSRSFYYSTNNYNDQEPNEEMASDPQEEAAPSLPTPAEFFFRGHMNTEVAQIKEDQWYEVDPSGRELKEKEEERELMLHELLTKRITGIAIAREVLLREYSQKLFTKDFTKEDFQKILGYRLWNSLEGEEESDLKKRLEFLKEYTRRSETTLLLSGHNLRKKLQPEILVEEEHLSRDFHSLALQRYLSSLSSKTFSVIPEEEKIILRNSP